jgi:outer membrane receptor protein involved in Fe transport
VTRTASLFGEATLAVLPRFSITAGGRFTIARTDGEPSFSPRGGSFVAGRTSRRVDPTAAVDWRLTPTLAAYARVQSGFRTGGLAVARAVGRVADFNADSIRVGEVGLRRLHPGELGLSLTAGLSFARWHDIQADLVNKRGLPYTVNLGDAQITAVEGTADWTPLRGLHASGSFLYTSNRITGSLAMLSTPAHRRLPETPPLAVNLDTVYQWSVGRRSSLSVGASGTRVGRSVLGAGDLLDISQGRYTTVGARAGWHRGRVDWTLTGENLGNTRANVFAMGNPFALAMRDLSTPLRPRTVRLGTALAW